MPLPRGADHIGIGPAFPGGPLINAIPVREDGSQLGDDVEDTAGNEEAVANTDSTAMAIADQSIADFKALDRKEKKARFKAVKKLIKEHRAEMRAGTDDENSSGLILLAILAILVPPLAIYLKERNFTWKFWASLALMVLCIIFFSSLAFLWLFAAALALLTVFDIL